MEEIKCLYRDSCKDYPQSCGTCVNNKGKKSHYTPDIEPYTPYEPYYPYYPTYPYYPPYPFWYPTVTWYSER